MQSFIIKIVEILLSVVTTIALTFSPITQAIANINIYFIRQNLLKQLIMKIS